MFGSAGMRCNPGICAIYLTCPRLHADIKSKVGSRGAGMGMSRNNACTVALHAVHGLAVFTPCRIAFGVAAPLPCVFDVQHML